jgi:hypothetical protein
MRFIVILSPPPALRSQSIAFYVQSVQFTTQGKILRGFQLGYFYCRFGFHAMNLMMRHGLCIDTEPCLYDYYIYVVSESTEYVSCDRGHRKAFSPFISHVIGYYYIIC